LAALSSAEPALGKQKATLGTKIRAAVYFLDVFTTISMGMGFGFYACVGKQGMKLRLGFDFSSRMLRLLLELQHSQFMTS
jgi:hypothetical protein